MEKLNALTHFAAVVALAFLGLEFFNDPNLPDWLPWLPWILMSVFGWWTIEAILFGEKYNE